MPASKKMRTGPKWNMPRKRAKFRSAPIAVFLLALTAGLCWYFQWPRWKSNKAKDVTFAHDVAPIVFARCSSCHRPDEAAPFSLLTYDDVRHRAKQIVDVTQKGFMPPWLPTEGNDRFADARRLTADELQILKRWNDSGATLGDTNAIPAPPDFTDAWKKNPPDMVLETPDYKLTGDDRDVFRNFVVPVHIESPRWVESIEIRPCNIRATHHARLGVDTSNESARRDGEDHQPGYAGMSWAQDPDGQLVIWAPGMISHPPAQGAAWRLYPHTSLVLHTHMQPTGKPEVVKFRIGIRFIEVPPAQRSVMMRIGTCDIDIPAGERRHTVKDQYTLPIDVDVHTIFPHAHSLCRELQVTAECPDGTRDQLISIANFDENWHDLYRYRAPVRLPRGTKVISTFGYDNSDANVRNRNRPAKRVVYGSNVNDEMADVYLQVTAVNADQRAALMEDYKQYDLKSQVAGYQRSLELYPDNPWSQEALATCFVGLGEPGKAIAILEKRIQEGPKAVFPVVSLGMAMLFSGDPVRAEAKQREAIAMDEKYPLAWFGLGRALAAQKKSDLAEQAFRRTAELAPGYLDARLQLVDLLIMRGELDEARNVCREAVRDSPDASALYLKMAEICAKRKNFAESLTLCEIARQLAPYTHPAKVLLAVFCFANKEQQIGLQLLREARVESPNHPMPALILGQLARQNRESKFASDNLAAAAAMPIPENWPQSHRQRFLVLLHSERFLLAQQLQDAELARDALTQWIKCDPANQKLKKMYDELPQKAAPEKSR
jgi:tetratricopeptide (TPR) repeat protein